MPTGLNTGSIESWLKKSISFNSESLPLVILSYAVSLDGCIAETQGAPSSISCRESEETVHSIRAYCDAILVGIGTVLSDNPRLTVRFSEGSDPRPVVFDTYLRTPGDSELFKSCRNPIIFCGENPDPEKAESLVKAGALIESCKTEGGKIPLKAALRQMYLLGIRRLMAEGGGEVISSFINEDMWDRMAVTVSPSILGGYNFFRRKNKNFSMKFSSYEWLRSGSDCICLIDRRPL